MDCREIVIEIIEKKINSLDELNKVIRKYCRKNKPKKVPSYIDILLSAKNDELSKLKFIKTKPVRTLSGVAPIAVMTKPIMCVHGKCIFCPGGPDSFYGDVPQSYTGKEPSTMRAIRNKYDPYVIIFNRLEQFTLLNQNYDKVELIFQGGTFTSFPEDYQEDEIKYSYKALNDFGNMFKDDFKKFKNFFLLPSNDFSSIERIKKLNEKILSLKKNCELKTEIKKNEKAKIRCVALCLETRPDFVKKEHVNNMLKFGCTRVELGVQSIYDSVLKKNKRGHDVKTSIEATKRLKDSFLKVGYHLMPGLIGSDMDKDVEMVKTIFSENDFMPDFIKFYPCAVIEGTELYELYKKNKFKPISVEDAIKIISKSKQYIPEWARVMRVQRDIPAQEILGGVNMTNLRQKITAKCRCIRCREPRDKKVELRHVKLIRRDYEASDGHEVFLSYEDVKNDVVVGFCRLRMPDKVFRPEITENSAGIRELHVYSESLGLGKKNDLSLQHKGYGIKLMQNAEKIANEEYDVNKILVISGVGAREYYKQKLNYKLDGVYMSKFLR